VTATTQKLIRAPISPAQLREPIGCAECSSYKNRNWYRRNVRKDMEPVVYHDSVDSAIDAAGLP
jgi:hypothetical protein